jgi:hypothetical protein
MPIVLRILWQLIINLPALIALTRDIIKLLDDHIPKDQHKEAIDLLKIRASNAVSVGLQSNLIK